MGEDSNNIITTFNPDLLIWARVNEALNRRQAVIKINTILNSVGLMTTGMLYKYENGISKPTLYDLNLFAQAYNRPLALFFMKDISNFKAKRTDAAHDKNYDKSDQINTNG